MSAANIAVAVRRHRSAVAAYLFLSALTGIVELGCVLYAARSGWALVSVALIGFLYQVASLLVQPFRLAPRDSRLVLAAGVATGFAATVTPSAFAVATLLIAVGLQSVRDEQLADVKVATLPKRCARIAGFVTAAAFRPWFLPAIAVLVLAVAATRPTPEGRRQWKPTLHLGPHALLMVMHQTHYFAYSYVLLFTLVRLYSPVALSAAIAFALGWISYTLAPVLFSRLPTLSTLVAGHLLVTAMLVVLAASVDAAVPFTLAWIVGGLGGGTVFCIKVLASRTDEPPDDIESWETVGHVSGSGLAVVAVGILPLPETYLVAAAFAAATAVTAVVIERRLVRSRLGCQALVK